MIRLIVTDLDGTLLNDEKHIPRENILVLKEAMERGIHVSIATGRNFHSAKEYIAELGLDVPVIFQNGAFIYQWMENKVIYQTALDKQIALKVIEGARNAGLFYILYADFLDEKDMYIDVEYKGSFSAYLRHNSWRLNVVEDVTKYMSNGKSLAEIALVGYEEIILRTLENSLNGFKDQTSVVKNNVVGDETFYEVFGPNSSKEHAMRFLFEHFKVKPEETMFLGDSYNDIGLLRMVGYPVVMDNGSDDVKQYGKYITKSNNDAGVAYAVRKWLLEQ
ncbi:MAG TPA: HAD family hydrolase [Fervidobacterium sp.]|nr:Cof-type HAD-IIB family hydrolase [Fervidobacterium sp.]HOQ40085.1 HAD family hydrolase [Fervidobacterium sp.]HPT54579.1 HAD family hydrolase [Fervidobacterium sp.]HPZ17998.1 HAD family hydrolase [Fervidobacterium sp.]HQE48964.1 HAD family hydrolase [Fervidobacterium sp.]